MIALFVVGIQRLVSSFKWHSLVKVFFNVPRYISSPALNRQSHLDCLAELVSDALAIIVQLIEVIDFKVCKDMIIMII